MLPAVKKVHKSKNIMLPPTKFSDLPQTVQLNILNNVTLDKQLSKLPDRRSDKGYLIYRYKKIRLVNHEWLQLVMSLNTTKIIINDESLQTFTQSPVTKYVGELFFRKLTKPLPIPSSGEMELPQAECLRLGYGISPENIKILLQYYIGNCTSLRFTDGGYEYYEGFVLPFKLDGIPAGLQVNKITNLEISEPRDDLLFGYHEVENVERNEFANYFIEMFNKIELPMLRRMVFKLHFRRFIPEVFGGNGEPAGYSANEVMLGFVNFFKKHGEHLKVFTIVSGSDLIWPWFIEFSQYLINLRRLEISTSDYDEDQGVKLKPDYQRKLRSLRMLKTLILNIVGTAEEAEICPFLIAYNWTTLNTFKLTGGISQSLCRQSGFDVVYPICDLKLTEPFSLYRNVARNRITQLSMVTNLTFAYKLSDDSEPDKDRFMWREILINWIVQIFPNLAELDIFVYSNKDETDKLEVDHVSKLIETLSCLTDMKFSSFHYQRKNLVSFLEKKNLVSIDAEKWIFANYPKSYAIRHSL